MMNLHQTAFPFFVYPVNQRLHTPTPPEVDPDPAPDDDPDPGPDSPPIPEREPDPVPPAEEPPAGDPPKREPPMHAGRPKPRRARAMQAACAAARQSCGSNSDTSRSTTFSVDGRRLQSSSVTRLDFARSSAKICV
ncbi:hypothetical protein SAMN05192539_100514 [Paraburkholderia diazotrophica]|uniref:Uncharacterized protein n=1 Tax=Paraburkholderia diazotrophica TaxID=667676 RepID=A0A1H6UEP8_9BURK|nr:hypothetical protein SAMN05192539_100514 [Paraburkholderia diazotrophica]